MKKFPAKGQRDSHAVLPVDKLAILQSTAPNAESQALHHFLRGHILLADLIISHSAVIINHEIASHADVVRGSSRVPAPRTSAESKDKFLSHCSQISAGNHIQIMGDPIGAVEVKVLTSQTHTYKLRRV